MGRGSYSVGRGCNLGGQGLLCSEITNSANFASSKISCDVGTHPLIESLSQRLKISVSLSLYRIGFSRVMITVHFSVF